MSNRRFEMHEYREMIFRMRQGESNRSMEREKVADRKKLRKVRALAESQGWLKLDSPLPSEEELAQFFKVSLSPKLSSVLPYEEQVTSWVSQGIQATVIHAALKNQYGFTGAYDAVQRFIKTLKSTHENVSMILDYSPGECAQVDFGAGPLLINELTGEKTKTWIFVMVLAFSRHQYAEIVLNQNVETWVGCHKRAFEWFGGVPYKMIIDNPKCAITKACYYDPIVNRSYQECAEGYGFIISPCPPREPKKKGRVESGVKYVKKNFLPLRVFRNINEANQQLKEWILQTAGNRTHGSTREKPLNLFETERAFLKALPAFSPELAIWAKVKLHGDCHVQFQKCRYSAPYTHVNQTLWLRATETTVRIYQDHHLLAVHPRYCKPGARHTINEHLPPNAQAYCMRDSQWCLEQAKKVGEHCATVIKTLLNDSVVDYLRAAQGIIQLQKKFGAARLESACKRALHFQAPYYRTIKSILVNGLDYAPLAEQESFDGLAETYTGKSRFCRDLSTLLQ